LLLPGNERPRSIQNEQSAYAYVEHASDSAANQPSSSTHKNATTPTKSLNKRTLYALDLNSLLRSTPSVQNFLLDRARAAVSQTVRVGENSARLGIPPQARTPCGFPILLWQTHSNNPLNHPSLPIRLLIHSIYSNQQSEIFMSSGQFFLEPIRSCQRGTDRP
jgi:hypothetical protein